MYGGELTRLFPPQELKDSSASSGWEVVHLAGICPMSEYFSIEEEVLFLEDDHLFELVRDVNL